MRVGDAERVADHPCYFERVDAAARKRARALTWTSRLVRGPNANDELAREAQAEWLALPASEKLALVWELSLEQYGGGDGEMEPRLPRSAYRVERR